MKIAVSGWYVFGLYGRRLIPLHYWIMLDEWVAKEGSRVSLQQYVSVTELLLTRIHTKDGHRLEPPTHKTEQQLK